MFGLVLSSIKKIRLELGLHPAHSMNQPQLSMSKLNQQKVLIYRCFYFFQYNLMVFTSLLIGPWNMRDREGSTKPNTFTEFDF